MAPPPTRRPRFGRASGHLHPIGILLSLVVTAAVLLLFVAWVFRDLG